MSKQAAGKRVMVYHIVFSLLVGLTGLEPVTLRLSSACSNQLSYRPWILADLAYRPVKL